MWRTLLFISHLREVTVFDDFVYAILFNQAYGSNDGACFGTYDTNRLRAPLDVPLEQAQPTRLPDYITIVDDFGDAVVVWVGSDDPPPRFWYPYLEPETGALIGMHLDQVGNGVYPIF